MKRLLFILVILITLTVSSVSCSPRVTADNSGSLAAIIVDQLYDSQPDENFINSITTTFTDYGFEAVDVYRGPNVGLELFLELPKKSAKVIILRNHSGLITIDNKIYGGTWIFTNEPCNQVWQYTDERLTGKIAKASVNINSPPVYAIGPKFVTDSMRGQFDNTIIIAMGCHSLHYDDVAKAFINSGASMYIGWTDLVDLDYSEEVIMKMLVNLCENNMTVNNAIEDATTGAQLSQLDNEKLVYYPLESGDKTFQQLIK